MYSALAKAGFKVAQIDVNEYYGGDQASLAADELATWADTRSDSQTFSSISRSGDVPPFARHYSLSLAPALLPSTGPFLSALIASGVSRYGAYRLLDRVAMFDGGALRAVPASKEDVVSFWQRVGRVTAALVRMVGGTANADWHVAARSAGPPRRR